MRLMEELLRIEADIKAGIGLNDRAFERTLKQELLKILEEAEHLFGPRDSSIELLEPRISEKFYAQGYGNRKIRIYLTSRCKNEPWLASYNLAHEAIHMLSPVVWGKAAVLEEGLATHFAFKYLKRVHGIQLTTSGSRKYDAAERGVSSLLANNEFLIKELRVHQPVISQIDEKLMIEVGNVEPSLAKFLCSDFETYGGATSPVTTTLKTELSETARHIATGLRSICD
ncbi:MAG TPA: hypothetical protein VFI24_21985 [Pyrinomonadaceae bacterium]|nr:hypothetical protein [Pyrinomonadaceae bacterium]